MWSSLKTATWLGWQIESNWASPALMMFVVTSVGTNTPAWKSL